MTEGKSFQLFGGGVREMVETDEGLVAAGDVIPLRSTSIEPAAPPVAAQPSRQVRAVAPAKQSVSPADVLRLAKDRVKELKAELRKMKSLQKELDELEKLLGRSKKTTSKNVRQLRVPSEGNLP